MPQLRERRFLGWVMAMVVGILMFVGVEALTGTWVAGAAAATGIFIAALLTLPPVISRQLDGVSRGAAIRSALFVLLALAAVAQTGRLALYMRDPSRTDCATLPGSRQNVSQSSLTGYFEAARLVRTVPDVYDESLYARDGAPRWLGPFEIEPYRDPPPFLLLPMALKLIAPDFRAQRALWFALEGLVLATALLMVARRFRGRRAVAATLLLPVVWLSLPTMAALQFGELQAVAVAAALIALCAFDDGHFATGGALLAFAAVAKIFPGLLVLQLLFCGKWRALLWTVAFGAAFVLLSLQVLGPGPFHAFAAHHLPRLTGSAAVAPLGDPHGVAVNQSVAGVVLKLKLLGLPPASYEPITFAAVGWAFTAVLVCLAWISRNTSPEPHRQAMVWLALLTIGTLHGPFVGQSDGLFAAAWLPALVLADGGWRRAAGWLALLAWAAANVLIPPDRQTSPALLTAVTLAQQALVVPLAFVALRRARGSALSRALTPEAILLARA